MTTSSLRKSLRVSLILGLLLSSANAGRCTQYVQQVRRYHYEVFGLNFPYWYGVGQLQQESNCRDVISNDGVGSQGLPQITLRVWQKYLGKHNIYDLKSVGNQLRAQAFIMKASKKSAYSSHLWVAYQLYNGGPLINKEIKRARIKYNIREVPHDIAREFCKRRIITFKSGYKLDACEINYDYSKKIFKYGQKYKILEDDGYIFW